MGATNYDEHDVKEGTEHVWPVWDGVGFCPEISEKNKGILFIKPVGGAIKWSVLGRYDKVTANHQDHLFSIYSPIVRSSGLFPGPCAWQTTPEPVSDILRDGKGERALLCGGPNRNRDRGAKEFGCASLNDVSIGLQASRSNLDSESVWSTFPAYTYDKGTGKPMCAIKLDVFGTTHVDFNRL